MSKLRDAGLGSSEPHPALAAATPIRAAGPGTMAAVEATVAGGGAVSEFTPIRGHATRTVHALDYRVNLPTLFWGSWYFVLLAGPERRNRARLEREGQTSWSRRFVAISAVLLTILFFAGIGFATIAYLVKCALGINIFPNSSFMHPIYTLLW
jgi:hypothetical protein